MQSEFVPGEILKGPTITTAETPQPGKPAVDMTTDLYNWGFGLIAAGIISIVLSEVLDPIWGGILILTGVLTLLIKRRAMFIVIGITLLLAGIANASGSGFGFGFWTVFGYLQFYYGIHEIRKFWKYASVR